MCRFGVFPCISLPHFFFARGPGCKACETLLAEGRELSSTVAMLKETLEPSGAAEMPSFKWIQLDEWGVEFSTKDHQKKPWEIRKAPEHLMEMVLIVLS